VPSGMNLTKIDNTNPWSR